MSYDYYPPTMHRTSFSPLLRAGDDHMFGTPPNYHPGVYQLHRTADQFQSPVDFIEPIQQNHPQLIHHRDLMTEYYSRMTSPIDPRTSPIDPRNRILNYPSQLLSPRIVVVERPLSLVTHVCRPGLIEQVWHENLEHEFEKIHHLLHMPGESRCFLASIDTEYPGVVQSTPVVDKGRLQDPLYVYDQMKSNVNATNIIQVGLTLANRHGQFFTWEFNFSDFDIETDVHNHASIELLKSGGIDFEKNKVHGIYSLDFAKLCARSGLLGKKGVPLTWVGFQGANDFGYLCKIFTRRKLPNHMETFMQYYVRGVFGASVFDIKHMIASTDELVEIYGGLDKVAAKLGVGRTAGESHTAGSDSLLTMQTFIQLLMCTGVFLKKPTHSGSSLIETLRKFTMIMSYVKNYSKKPMGGYFESLISGEEECEKENYRSLTRCHGLKGLGFVIK